MAKTTQNTIPQEIDTLPALRAWVGELSVEEKKTLTHQIQQKTDEIVEKGLSNRKPALLPKE